MCRPRRAVRICAPVWCTLTLLVLVPRAGGQTVEETIDSLPGRLTLEENILQLHESAGFVTADNTRLGIPGFSMADGPHGVRDGSATSFPVSIAMAATWDVGLAERVGAAMGAEFQAKGKHQALGPSMDLHRDPRNGRGPETGGEDPYLCAVTLEIFNVLGQVVARPVVGERIRGWHSVGVDASGFASGMYLYRLRVGGEMLVRRMNS